MKKSGKRSIIYVLILTSVLAYAGQQGGSQGIRQQIASITDICLSESDIIESKLGVCCTALDSALDIIESKIDAADASQAISKLSMFSSSIDVCCSSIESQLTIIESKLDQSDTQKIASLVETIASAMDAPSCAATPITTTTTLSLAGAYCLANNISGDVAITGTGITLDLCGRTISGGTYGLNISGDSVTIVNGMVKNASSAAIKITGSNCTIDECTLSGSPYGLLISQATRNRITNCCATNNTTAGFSLVNSTTTMLSNCSALANNGTGAVYGFITSGGMHNIFHQCAAEETVSTGSSAYGFYLNESADTLSNNFVRTVQSAGSYFAGGITGNSSPVISCVVQNNFVSGVHSATGSAGVGYTLNACTNLFINNSAYANNTDYGFTTTCSGENIWSQLDLITSLIDVIPHVNLAPLISRLDSCATQIDSQLDRIESKIDFTDSQIVSQLNTLDSKIAVCATQLDSQLDRIESNIDFTDNQIVSQLNALDSKLALCATQLDSQLDRIESKIDFNDGQIVSQLNALDSKFAVCSMQLDSQLDRIESKIDFNESQFTSQLNALDSKVAVCATQLDSQLDRIESKIDFNDSQIVSQLNALDSKVAVCATQLDSQLDRIESKIDFNDNQITSQLNALDSKVAVCATQLDSQLDRIESKIDFNDSQITSQLSALDSKVAVCATQLDSQLDRIESNIDFNDSQITSQLNALDSKITVCATQLDSQLDRIESKIDFNDSQITSQLSALDSKVAVCATQLNSQLDRIESKIDFNDSQIVSQLNALDSKVAVCATQLDSQLDRIESKIDFNDSQIVSQLNALDSKVAVCATQLDSQLDRIESKIDLPTCDATPITTSTTLSLPGAYCLTQNISGDVSITGTGITLDLAGRTISGGTYGISISGDEVILRNGTIQNATSANLYITGNKCLIEGCNFVGSATGLYLYNCSRNIITDCSAMNNTAAGFSLFQSNTNMINNCNCIGTSGSTATYGYVTNFSQGNIFQLCKAKNIASSANRAYGFYAYNGANEFIANQIFGVQSGAVQSAFGMLFSGDNVLLSAAATSTAATQGNRGITWSPDGRYLAIGVSNNIEIYRFNGISLTYITNINLGTGNANYLSWSPAGDYIAMAGNSTSNLIQIYRFNGSTATPVTGLTPPGAPFYLIYARWSNDGNYLVANSGGSTFLLYSFNKTTSTLTLKDSPTFGTSNLSAAWSPNNQYLAIGGKQNTPSTEYNVKVYSFDGTSLTLTTSYNFDANKAVYSVNWSPDGKYLAMNNDNQSVGVCSFNQQTLSLIATHYTAMGAGNESFVDWSPDGRHLNSFYGSGGSYLEVCIFDGSTIQSTAKYSLNANYWLACSPIASATAYYIAATRPLPSGYGVQVISATLYGTNNIINNNLATGAHSMTNSLGTGYSLNACANLFLDNIGYNNDIDYGFTSSCTGENIWSQLDVIENHVNTPISSAGTISQSGSYQLTNDINGDITITGTGIMLDLNGHIINAYSKGLLISGKDVIVKNGVVLGTNQRLLNSGAITYGVSLLNASQCTLQDIVCADLSGAGIVLSGSSSNRVNSCSMFSIKGNQFDTDPGGKGIWLRNGSYNNSISNCSINGVYSVTSLASIAIGIYSDSSAGSAYPNMISNCTIQTIIANTSCTHAAGISINSPYAWIISGCTITDVGGSASALSTGIDAVTTANGVIVNGNICKSIISPTTSYGISFPSSSGLSVVNNTIITVSSGTGVNAPGAATNTNNAYYAS